jgi:hypothetical protein
MAEEGSLDVGVFGPVWTAGWQWPWAVVLALMLGLNFLLAADRLWLGGALLLGGPALAAAGVRAVNRRWGDALETGTVHTRRAAAADAAGDATVYSLRAGTGSVPGLDPSKRYELTTLTVGERTLRVHEGASVDLFTTRWTGGDGATEYPYDRLAAVDHENGGFRIDLVDGSSLSYPADRVPRDLLADVEARIRDGGRTASGG